MLISLWPGLGDIMFATPAIRLIRRAYPEAFIAAASLAGGPGAPLLETNPYLDEVYFQARGTYSAGGLAESLSWARSRRFDVGLELSHPVQWFFRLSGIDERQRFARRALWWLVPYRDKACRDLHASEQFIRAAEKAFGPLGRDGLGYDLVLTRGDEERAQELLSPLGGAPFAVIHPGARCNRNKRWETAKFAGLGRWLAEERGFSLVIVGGSEDEPLAEAMGRELEGPVLSLAGEATLRQTAAVIERAGIYVGNDSGPLHIAASTGTPVVAIFASSNPANFGPPGACSQVVSPTDECVPCLHFPGYNWLPWGLRLRYYDRCAAMERLDIEDVSRACSDLLDCP